MQTEAETEGQMDERLKATNFRVYGFKFPLGVEAYSISIESVKGGKETVIAFKRKVDEFWAELTDEVMQHETSV